MTYRILVTGSREWTDEEMILGILRNAPRDRGPVVIVHGDALGADQMARRAARIFGYEQEVHPSLGHASPKHRNDHMVRLGADVCLAFAETWASGTGHCARAARKFGIPVTDYGVDTRIEARP